jgi:hypothetical protein
MQRTEKTRVAHELQGAGPCQKSVKIPIKPGMCRFSFMILIATLVCVFLLTAKCTAPHVPGKESRARKWRRADSYLARRAKSQDGKQAEELRNIDTLPKNLVELIHIGGIVVVGAARSQVGVSTGRIGGVHVFTVLLLNLLLLLWGIASLVFSTVVDVVVVVRYALAIGRQLPLDVCIRSSGHLDDPTWDVTFTFTDTHPE